jgi:CheY-specific phosphatase CheX
VHEEDRQRIDDAVVSSTASVLEGHGLAVAYAGVVAIGDVLPDATAVVLGFAGEEMRGSVLLSAPDVVLASSYPVAPPPEGLPKEELIDWAGELANLLLGRIKHRLATYGVRIQLSTPTAVTGFYLQARSPGRDLLRAVHAFDVGESTVFLRFEAAPSAGLVLRVEEPPPPLPQEGEPILFF